jgi:hypothetical protein
MLRLSPMSLARPGELRRWAASAFAAIQGTYKEDAMEKQRKPQDKTDDATFDRPRVVIRFREGVRLA